MTPQSSTERTLAPLASVLWPLYVAVSILVALVWISGFSDGAVVYPTPQKVSDLRMAMATFARALDPVWITLGAMVIYLCQAQFEGLENARRWFLITYAVGFGIAVASVMSTWPLGSVFFPEKLGWKIGPVPFAFPLLCWVVVAGGRAVMTVSFPRLSHNRVAVATGGLAALTSINLDPLASTYRAWWIWAPARDGGTPHSALQTHAVWFLLGLLLAWLMRSTKMVPARGKRRWLPVVVFGAVNLVALATHLALRLR